MARAAIFQRLQLGPEVTAGTAVPADIRLQATGAFLRPRTPLDPFRPMGDKFNTTVTAQKEWSEAQLRGVASYNDLTYLFSSLLRKAAVAGTWVLKPDPFEPDTIQTFSFEAGSSAGAEKFAYGFVNSLDLRFTRREASVTGTLMGRKLTEGATMTAAPTTLGAATIDPKSIEVQIGNTIAGLAKITNCLEVTLGMRDRMAGFFPFDPAQDSFTEHLELAPNFTAGLVVAHDAVSAGWMADARAKTQKFLRIISIGPVIGAGPGTYEMNITIPFLFQEPDRNDQDDVFVSNWTLLPNYHSSLGSAIEVEMVNELADL